MDLGQLRVTRSRFRFWISRCGPPFVLLGPASPNEPMSTFAPMVRRVMNKPWVPPAKAV
jgi:hypothetical protein